MRVSIQYGPSCERAIDGGNEQARQEIVYSNHENISQILSRDSNSGEQKLSSPYFVISHSQKIQKVFRFLPAPLWVPFFNLLALFFGIYINVTTKTVKK